MNTAKIYSIYREWYENEKKGKPPQRFGQYFCNHYAPNEVKTELFYQHNDRIALQWIVNDPKFNDDVTTG